MSPPPLFVFKIYLPPFVLVWCLFLLVLFFVFQCLPLLLHHLTSSSYAHASATSRFLLRLTITRQPVSTSTWLGTSSISSLFSERLCNDKLHSTSCSTKGSHKSMTVPSTPKWINHYPRSHLSTNQHWPTSEFSGPVSHHTWFTSSVWTVSLINFCVFLLT